MKLSGRQHRVAAVLAVVFVLTTVWAAYYFYSQTQATAGPSAPASLASVSATGANGFAAALRPSYLYNNSTEIYGGNVTLFAPITNWINVTLSDFLSVNRTAELTLKESFSVALSTPAWSKVVFTGSNATAANGTSVGLHEDYAINVSATVQLVQAIDRQIGYSGTGFTLSLDPRLTGTIAVAGQSLPIELDPALNFTFSGSEISPSGLAYTTTSSVLAPVPPGPVAARPGAFAYLAVFASLGGLGVSMYVVSRPSDEAEVVPPLPELIAPYEEVIAETEAGPAETETLSVARFSDLVKIADTLGKPILRPRGRAGDGETFLVVDRGVSYAYRYPGGGPDGAETPGPTGAGGIPEPGPGIGVTPRSLEILLRLHRETGRLRELAPNRVETATAALQLHLAIASLRQGRDEEAARAVDDLARLVAELSAAGGRATRAGRRSA